MDKYSYGLGQKSNNQSEMYGLFLGISLAQEHGIKDINILGDSFIIIC